ncbi:MAG TPA: XdhC family protein [Burkholderiales bacterium]|nr:XdhC family protein [Burkholderiales bacterium]
MRPELLALAASLAARGERFALVTVVRREPPSSARVGDTALVTEAGEYHGWAGGGCTREVILRESRRAIADGEPRLLSLSPGASGEMRPGMQSLPMACESGGTVEIYVEPVLPALRLAIFGATPAAEALARIGQAMGYEVQRSPQDNPQSDLRGAHVLIATMGDDDLELLQKVLAAGAAYVGVIASRRRFEHVRETLVACRVPREALEKVHAPAGLDIGAKGPEEIALSVMAQIVQERRKKPSVLPAEVISGEAIDPICKMTVNTATARHKAEVEGRMYYFCCAGCKSKFLEKGVRA